MVLLLPSRSDGRTARRRVVCGRHGIAQDSRFGAVSTWRNVPEVSEGTVNMKSAIKNKSAGNTLIFEMSPEEATCNSRKRNR